jgi:SAM-dependent methyltransferase
MSKPADRDFWNKLADRYAASPIGDVPYYERKLALTQALFRPEMKVLEFGCGTGGTAIQHAPYVAGYRAMDSSERMIEIARDKENADTVRFEVGDFDETELVHGSLDMILGLSILHLLPDPEATIAKIYCALRPGGYFVSSTTCVGSIRILRLIAPIGQALGKIPHLSWFTEDGLRAMIRSTGFEIVEDLQPEGRNKALFLIARKTE